MPKYIYFKNLTTYTINITYNFIHVYVTKLKNTLFR